MKFKFSDDFTSDLKNKVAKPGVAIFIAEALSELEKELSARPRFFDVLKTERRLILKLDRYGSVQIVKGDSRSATPRFIVRLLNAPGYVFVTTCENPTAYFNDGEVRVLAFLALLELCDEIKRIATQNREVMSGM